MLATRLIHILQWEISSRGDLPVEIETPREILAATTVRVQETDAARGNTIIVVSDGKRL